MPPVMDHTPIRQTLKFENNFSTFGKSFPNLVNCEIWLYNIVKYRKYSNVKFANFVYFCITREKALPHFPIVHGSAFLFVIQKYTKFANFIGLYFPHFTIFWNQTSQFH